MKKLSLALVGLLTGFSGIANATLVHKYTFNEGSAADAIGNADMNVNGNASLKGGELILPGGGTRVNNASAAGASLTELAATINGSTVISMELWFTQSQNSGWSKLFMAGQGFDNKYMDITPRRGNDNNVTSIAYNTGSGESTLSLTNSVAISNNVEYYLAAVWNQGANTMQLYLAKAGDPSTAATMSRSMDGKMLSDLTINELYLGSPVQFGDNDFYGKINEFRIYNNALTSADFSANCLAGPEISVANTPEPANDETLVFIDTDLQWQAPNAYTIDSYNIYIGDDPNMDDAARTGWTATSIDPAVDMGYALANDIKYYWRVDTLEPNGLDPIVHTGDVWAFTTVPPVPVITADPVSQTVSAGAVVSLGVTALNADAYTWYQSTDTIVDEADAVVGSGQTVQITVNGIAEEGWYYCKASSVIGSDVSAMAHVMTKRLVGWWPLDGSLEDAIASEIAGAPSHDGSSESPNFVTGISGQGYKFLGDGKVVTIADSVDYFNFYTSGVTVSCWVSDQNPSIWDTVVSKEYNRNPDWYVASGYFLARSDFGAGAFGIRRSEAVSSANQVATGDGSWHLLTGVFDSDNKKMRIYVDGAFKSEINADPATFNQPNLAPLIFGAESTDGVIGRSSGTIDDVRIWSYPLDSWQVAQLYVDLVDAVICVQAPAGDLDGNCEIDLNDFVVIAQNWLESGNVKSVDLQ